MCGRCLWSVCLKRDGEEGFKIKTLRDIQEERQRKQVVLRVLLKEARGFLCQQINKCETEGGLYISQHQALMDIK